MRSLLARSLFLCGIACMQAWPEFLQGSIGSYRIWMDLPLSPAGDSLHGEYFYVSRGEKIPLAGMRSGDSVELVERDARGNVTGELRIAMGRHSWSGIFRNDARPKRLAFEAKPVGRKIYERAFFDARNRRLDREDSSLYLANAGRNESSQGPEEDCGNGDQFSYNFKNDHLRSIQIFHDLSVCGGYPDGESESLTYETEARRSIDFWEEIDSASRGKLTSIVQAKMQVQLEQHRSGQSDSAWRMLLQTAALDSTDWNAQGELDLKRIFSGDHGFVEEFHLSENGVELVWNSQFGFPHVSRAWEFCGETLVPIADLDRFLKKGSALRWMHKSLRKGDR